MPSRRRAIVTLLAGGIGTACRATTDPASSALPTIDDLAERYVRLTLRMALHQPSLVETWLGPEEWRPGPREPVAKIQDEIVAAHAALVDRTWQPELSDRLTYLTTQFDALLAVARRLAGETMRFGDEARLAFGVTAHQLELNAAEITAARAELDHRLPGRGAIHKRYATFRLRHRLPPDRALAVFRQAVVVCRSHVASRIELPAGESIDLVADAKFGQEARAVYQGNLRTRVRLDPSGAPDLARLVWLAAHETFPGHHVQHVLADRDCVRAKGWHERALHPTFGTHLLVAEGAAEAGAALFLEGDGFEEVCRILAPAAGVHPQAIGELVAVHRAVVSLDSVIPAIAQQYLDGAIGNETAVERLKSESLVSDPRHMIAVIERQRTRLVAYPVGRRMVAAHLGAGPTADRWSRLARIATYLTLSG
jgi:hypothetical protein